MWINSEVLLELQKNGWTQFEMDVDQQLLQGVNSSCTALRTAVDLMLKSCSSEGLPDKPIFSCDVDTKSMNPRYEKLQLFQAQQNIDHGFGRVSTELTLTETELPFSIETPDYIREMMNDARSDAIAVGHLAAGLFGLSNEDIHQQQPTAGRRFSRAQFIHTWYAAGGHLFGDHNHAKGHKDTPYSGATFSLNLRPNSTARWTIGEGSSKRFIEQTGSTVVAMLGGKQNPYHLVEVDDPREAVLFRLSGDHLETAIDYVTDSLIR